MPFMAAEDGVPIYYTDQGRGSPIFLIHGWTMNHKFFRHNIPALSRTHRVCQWISEDMGTPVSKN
ncbi:MAG: hypothetical protein JOZ19_05095 [Rubrobacter sp.]|nr:hypothetical protein [Rubrobacter sp.]